MTIGLPKALMYHRYGHLWNVFFRELGADVVVSGKTSRDVVAEGSRTAMSECCLPAKVYLGHVRALVGRCDRILVARLDNLGRDEEMCVEYWGAYDVVRNTFPQTKLLGYNVSQTGHHDEKAGFMGMGRQLGHGAFATARAYRLAKLEQGRRDAARIAEQETLFGRPGLKVMVAAQPCVLHDPALGGPVIDMIAREGGVPVLTDYCDRAKCKEASVTLSRDLYWSTSREMVGALALHRHQIDGIVFLTAFPCGGDSLVNELMLRRIKDIPAIQIVVDEQSAEAGLQTRIESFMDILSDRRRAHG